ncbi:glycoside hydrolase family 37 [candidate division KSB3 bacterium]|nr:glycoside hydrolase family 37 [candidate division KSB3 bacterium]
MSIGKYCEDLKKHISSTYKETLREAGGALKYPFVTPGSKQYDDVLWDWDAWLSNVALGQILADLDDATASEEAWPYEIGCILNPVAWQQKHFSWMGKLPGTMRREEKEFPQNPWSGNNRKPCFVQHAAYLAKREGGKVDWLLENDALYCMQTFLHFWKAHQNHKETGLYLMAGPGGGGSDDDPTVFGRPPYSTATIFLNSLMYRDLEAMVYLLKLANLNECAVEWEKERDHLRDAIREYCYDPRDGYFYSFDVNLVPEEPRTWYHSGRHRHWPGLIMRIETWMGMMPLWAGVATEEQAERAVEHYRDENTLNCPGGIRTLSKMEKMYRITASGNPSCWLGPVWGASNYLTWRGLVRYGFEKDAKELAEKTVKLFGQDLERNGALHEYYEPSGEPILNPGFQNWNHCVMLMIAYLEGREPVYEF